MPKVSIIVPVYNKEKYIKKCLTSLMKQTLTEIEIIVVDDGSVDDSVKIIKEISLQDSRIILLRESNRGSGIARNRGLKIAKGEFVLFVDADDTIKEDTLSTMYAAACENNSEIIVCGMEICYPNGDSRIASQIKPVTITLNNELVREYISKNGSVYGSSACNKLFQRKLLQLNGVSFKPCPIGEDFLFCIDAMRVAHRITSIEKAFYQYWQYDDSKMHDAASRRSINGLKLLIRTLLKYADTTPNEEQKEFRKACANACVKLYFRIGVYMTTGYRMREKRKILKELIRKRPEFFDEVVAEQLARVYRWVYFSIKARNVTMLQMIIFLFNYRNRVR